MTEKRTATCMLCEATCGIVVTVGDGEDGQRRMIRVDGDRDDTFSRGYICPKAAALDDVRLDPDRIVRPMRRLKSGEHAPISWNEALDESASKLAAIMDEHGPHAVATYVGNPLAHSYAGILGSILFNQSLGSFSRFSATSADQLPQMLAAFEMFGHQALMAVPDLDRTRHLLILGGNPLVSNGSIMTAPGMKRRLEELRERGGRVVVVDPRRSETARAADEHHFIVPGTDALLLLAMLAVVFEENLVRVGDLSDLVDGLDDLRRVVKAFAPSRVAARVGIDEPTIRRLAIEHARAEGAAAYVRVGACTQEFGGLVAWLAIALDVVTGNLDRAGGKMFATPAVDVVGLANKLGLRGSFNRFQSRVRKLPEFGGELPVAALAEEITTPGKKRIRSLVTMAGNPVLSTPNGGALEAALSRRDGTAIDFMVSVDLYKNETTRHADIILPPTFGLEREHYDMVLYAFAVRNVARYAEPVFAPRGETRNDWDILSDLALRVVRRRKGAKALGARMLLRSARAAGSSRILDGMLRLGPHRLSLEKLRKSPHGLDLGALVPRLRELLGERRIEIAPRVFLEDLARLTASIAVESPKDELRLIGRRSLRSNNSWMHNSDRLTKGPSGCTLLMHPDDARARGVSDGQDVVLRSRTGMVRVAATVSDEVAPGVVSLPHGWGHARADLRVARERAGVSVNDVTDETFVDTLTGTAAFSGVPVTVEVASP